MGETDRSVARRWPVMFCCAIAAPYSIMTLGGAVASRYMWPDPGGYTPLKIILAFVAAEILVTWCLVVWGWVRGERPRWLALFGPFSAFGRYGTSFSPNQSMQPTAGRCTVSLHFMKTCPLETTLAFASGG